MGYSPLWRRVQQVNQNVLVYNKCVRINERCVAMNSSASEFGKDLGLMHEVVVTGRKCGFTKEDWGVLAHDEGKLNQVLRFLRGEAELVIKTESAPAPEPDHDPDPIIRVDRSIRPSYPGWMKEVMHPELENVGPAEYDISAIEQWLHDGQGNGKYIKGNKIYNHLEKTDTLKTCLGLRDLEEIQKKGIAFFRKHFKGRAVFGWATIVRYRNGNLYVPYLYENDGGVVLNWDWTGSDWNGSNPALRFASSTQT